MREQVYTLNDLACVLTDVLRERPWDFQLNGTTYALPVSVVHVEQVNPYLLHIKPQTDRTINENIPESVIFPIAFDRLSTLLYRDECHMQFTDEQHIVSGAE